MAAFSPLSLLRDLEAETKAACDAPANRFGAEYFIEHIVPVRENAIMLGTLLGADPFCLSAAAYLHDLAAIKDFTCLGEHAKASAEFAVRRLRDGHAPEPLIALIRDAILSHGTPMWRGEAAPETVCLSNADAMAAIEKPAYWLRYAFVVKGLPYMEGCRFLFDWYERSWNSMIDEAKTLSAADFSAVYRIFASVFGFEGMAPAPIELQEGSLKG